MNLKITIIILNWNGANDTIECINSLKEIKNFTLDIFVIENGSDQDDYLELKNKFPEIKLIRCEENLGFAGGNNLGIKYAMNDNPDYILLLNNDTTVEPDFIDRLLKVFEKKSKAGIVAPRINYYYEPKKIWTEGGKISRIRGSGFAYSERYDNGVDTEFRSVTFVSGCCMLIKRELIETIGMFDKNYFLYVEDTDFCKRTLDSGYKIYIAYSSKIFHKVSSSTNKNLSVLPLYYMTRNRLYFAKKNFPKTHFITFFYILITMLIKSIIWISQGKANNISIVSIAFSDFLRGNMGKVNEGKLKVK